MDGRPPHFHSELRAGENTLNAQCARLLLRSIASEADGGVGRYSKPGFLGRYVAMMTTDGGHRDSYAEAFHRQFFQQYFAALERAEARGDQTVDAAAVAETVRPGRENHDTASIGGLVMLVPVLLTGISPSVGSAGALRAASVHLAITHDSQRLQAAAQVGRGAPTTSFWVLFAAQ